MVPERVCLQQPFHGDSSTLCLKNRAVAILQFCNNFINCQPIWKILSLLTACFWDTVYICIHQNAYDGVSVFKTFRTVNTRTAIPYLLSLRSTLAVDRPPGVEPLQMLGAPHINKNPEEHRCLRICVRRTLQCIAGLIMSYISWPSPNFVHVTVCLF